MLGLRYSDQIKGPVEDEFQNLVTQLRSFLLVSLNEDGTVNDAALNQINVAAGGPSPANSVVALDGSASSGVSISYSRGDHKHADTNRPTTAEKAALLRLAAAVSTLTDGATPALNALLSNSFKLTASGDRTIAIPTNPTNGQTITILHKANGGIRTLALNTGAGGFRFGTTITGLTATASGKTDYITAFYNAADNFWDVIGYSKEY